MVWTEDGRPLQGLTGGGERIEWILPEKFRDGKEHVFYIEMACNGMFGNAPGGDSIQPPDPNKYYQLHTARITAVNLEARALHYDFWMIGGTSPTKVAESAFSENRHFQTRRENFQGTHGSPTKPYRSPMR
jgi:hypothetical protein